MPKAALVRVTLQIPWQGKWDVAIGTDYVDFYKDDSPIRYHTQVRRFPDCLSKELHYVWFALLGKFKLDENDTRLHPVGVDFKRLS